jgi:hypothetical protein
LLRLVVKVGLPEIVEAVQVTGLLVPFVVKVSAPPTIGITNQLVDELAAILHPPVKPVGLVAHAFQVRPPSVVYADDVELSTLPAIQAVAKPDVPA